MTTLGDAVIEVLERGEEGKVSGAKNGGGWPEIAFAGGRASI